MGLAAMTMRAALLASLVIALTGGQDIPLGVYGPVTTRSQLYLALVASFDLDLRKNFEPALRSRLGDPIIQITDLQPELANIKVRIGNSAGTPETGVATALDFMLGLDGEPPIVGLVGGVFSSISMPIASVAAVQKVTQISYGSTSPALSNKDTYPYFLRTVPPDSIQGQAFWNWIVAFEVPMAVCLYAVEPYGQGLFLAIEEQAKAAGQEGRLKGVSVRYMPNTFVVAEATESCRIAKSLGSRFIFVSMNSQMSNEFVVVLRDEGMLQSGWQVLGSEAFTPYGPTIFEADLPVGVMRWNPVSRGTKFANFTNLWSQLTVNDVMSADARSRYKYDNFKVPLSSATVPAVTDANFANGDLPSYDSFLFDACYTFVVAINELLKSGVAVADIKQQTLLDQVKITQFEGISGPVSFNANGDRLASYELLNQHPDGSGGTTLVQAGMFSATTGVLTIPGGQLYWMDGQIWPKPPDVLTNCDAGFYKEETSGQCKACPRGFQCAGGALPYQQCSRGYFANITGMVECLPCAEGFFAAEVGSAECSPCLAGFYMDITGQEACKKCPKGTYMPDKQAIQCIPCSMGQGTEESGAQSMSECRCAEGSFLCNSSGFTAGCQACPDGLQCAAGLDPPTQQPGFWTSGGDTCSFDVIRCRDQLECPGQAMGDCAQGREGIACNNCVEGYYPLDDGTCLPCGPGDSLPAIFTGIAAVIIIIFLLSSVNADLNQQSLNLLTVAAVGSQMVMAVQALGSIRQLSIQWVDPVREIIEFTRLLTFDFDIIRISCITGQDSPTLKFLGQLLACPMGACVIVVAYFVAKMRGRKMSLDAVFNLNGILLFALFITLTLAVLGPFQCLANPDGSSSMAANPGVLCFDSGEHTGLVILSILGIIFYPFTILTWATYTTVKYPSRINSGRGLQLVNRYRFLFQRFKPECYYYGLVLLWRNAFVALFPVLFVAVPEVQVVLMGALFVCGGALQVRVWPWRTEQANYADLVMTSLLQVVLLGAAPLLEIDEANSTEILGWLLCVAVLGPFLAGIGAICYSIWRHFQPSNVFGMFLCHHKGGAGSLCRLIKLLISRHSNCNVFLDSDQLEDLDLIFDTIRANTKSVVIVLTPELLKRMWCAGEIVTAFKNKVTTVPLICDGFVPLTAETLEAIPDVWTAQQKQILANYGITMDDVKQAYVWVRDELSPLTLSRFGPQQQREDVVVEIVQRAKVAMKVFRSNAPTGGKVKARILITGSVTDAEALATLEVFQILVQNHLRVECAMVRSSKELLAHKPYAHYFVVLFSRGMLRDPRFAQILLSTGAGKEVEEGAEEKHLEIVTVSADTGFEFPSAEFYKELEMQGLGEGLGPESGPTLAKAYRALLNVLALPLSPLGSEGLLEKQVSEISRRFRRYKDPASAIAMDNEEDLKHGGDGVDTRALGAELAKEQKEVAAAVSTMTGTMKQDMSQPNVVTRVNSLVQSLERPYIDLTGSKEIPDVDINNPEEFSKLDSPQMAYIIAKELKYFTKQGEDLTLKPITNWVIADLANKEGRALVTAALKQMKSSTSTRVGLIHNPPIRQTDDQPELLMIARTVEAVLASKDHVTPSMLAFMESLLDENNDFDKLSQDSKAMEDLLAKISGLKVDAVKAKLSDGNALKGKLFSHQAFCRQVVNLHPGQPAVIANGRVLGPLAGNTLFTEDDFKLLENFDMDLYARKVRDQVDEMQFESLSADEDTSDFRSDIIMKASSALISREKRSRQDISFKGSEHSVMKINANQEGPSFDVAVIVDPLSKAAQKIAPILMVLQDVTNVNIRLAMNSREKLSELPLNRFYRYVLEPQLTFDEDGAMTEGPLALFSDMPQSVLLTMGMDTPLGWMVEAVYSPHDLDNIKLQEVEKQVMAKFELEYIFIEGHCSDFDTRQPPRGLQFTLGTPRNPVLFDTIVMANLGYFQLKAYPGAWSLRVREGRSAEIYDIESVSGSTEEQDKHFTVVVDSFIGKLLKVKVKRKPGMEGKDLLSDSDSQSGGIWDSLTSIVGSDTKAKAPQDETINVFSVASGHLYERFIRIMMLTVMKNTKSPVKFWFLKNFLSPSLTAFLPHMAKEYGFDYELVQYHWPHWLHAQTEKQRTIWGYKILFLDVLFPLHVKKIIFVDADLIVRADLKELNEIDLHGAPYAYTPFCSSRKEMDGFRFWNVGYWRSHLGGRPYHISALYVVDLDRFRRLAAGDRLRGQYQGLSQDPNSLSNLDQDLPNNMIHQVPIRSLPQEWLWCETWCDDESKSRAKAIDLCNNPMTKEPKLHSAVRIVKEWPDYDNEIRRLQESVAAKMAAEKSDKDKPTDLPKKAKEEL